MISLRCSSNSEALASELLEHLEEIHTHSDVFITGSNLQLHNSVLPVAKEIHLNLMNR